MFLYQKGQIIDKHYTVLFPHKESSYAETYRVKNEEGRLCFLKLIYYSKLKHYQFAKDAHVVEVDVAKCLNHHNVCKCVDSGSFIYNGVQLAYIVTEFVSGETLDKYFVREQELSVYDVKEIAKAVLNALQFLHSQEIPIIHNDITIKNVLVDLTGTMLDSKLIDYGHARFLNQQPAKFDLSDMNPFYMAPECFTGVCCVQSDLYSVGILMYHLLYGMLPYFFDTSNMKQENIIERLSNERQRLLRIPNIEKFELDEQLILTINKAVQADVDSRFQSAEDFLQALDGKKLIGNVQTESLKNSEEKPRNVKKGNGFADVAGMTELKEQLRSDVIDLLKNPEQAKELGLCIPNGILFYGPPGCGKTFFAEKFAEETGFNYMYVKGSDVASPYIDGGKGKIANIFKEARNNAPTILFLDEVDALLSNRSNHNNPITAGAVNEFLMQLNNCGKDNVLVIGATNKPLNIDEAAIRAGRLELKYYIPQPDKQTRKCMFEINVTKRKYDFGIDYGKLADMTENYVSADIALVVENAARLAFRRKTGKITMALLEESVTLSRPSLTEEQIKQHESIRDKFMGNKKDNRFPKIGFR